MQTTNKVTRAVRYAVTLGALSAGMFSSTIVSAQEETAKEENAVERIEVTGSRILREGAIAPSPVTVISGDDLVNAGAINIGECVEQVASFSNDFLISKLWSLYRHGRGKFTRFTWYGY